MFDLVIGIDPGKSGGIACVYVREQTSLAIPMPETERDIIDEIEILVNLGTACIFLEKVGSIFPKGKMKPSPKAMFNFGKNYGFLRGAALGSKTRLENVQPKTWQKAIGVYYPAGANNTVKKNISKARAQELFPHLKITHKTSDALLIAEFGKRAVMLEEQFSTS